MTNLKYCSNCGGRNEIRKLEGCKRPVCTQCGIVHYENPRPAVTVIVVSDSSILLVKRGVPPARGSWCLPGGFMEVRESAAEAARRELAEETGLIAQELSLQDICPFPGGRQGNILVLGFLANSVSGQLTPGDDALEARFFPFDKMPKVTLKCHRELIRRFLESLTGEKPVAENSRSKDSLPATG